MGGWVPIHSLWEVGSQSEVRSQVLSVTVMSSTSLCVCRQLNQSYIDGLGIHYLPGWKDPWGERPMTFGEVGCFLSHYNIWQKVSAMCG